MTFPTCGSCPDGRVLADPLPHEQGGLRPCRRVGTVAGSCRRGECRARRPAGPGGRASRSGRRGAGRGGGPQAGGARAAGGCCRGRGRGRRRPRTVFHGAGDGWREQVTAARPAGRPAGQVDEIAGFVVFLLSDRGGAVTGSVIDWVRTFFGGPDRAALPSPTALWRKAGTEMGRGGSPRPWPDGGLCAAGGYAAFRSAERRCSALAQTSSTGPLSWGSSVRMVSCSRTYQPS